jgi:hypothetical protein
MEQIIIHSLFSEGYYLNETGGWTSLLTKARKFSSAREADRLCREQKLNKVEILVLRDGQVAMNIPVNLNAPAL